jgi:AraC-like DNA-binding protein
LYEPAAPGTELRPLWRLDAGRTLFIGALDHNDLHQHGAPVFLSSLGGPFGLRLGGGPWLACEAAMIPAGKLHELHLGGEPLAVFYVEPDLAGAGELAPLLSECEEIGGCLVGRSSVKRLLRALYEDGASLGWADEALDDLLDHAKPRARRGVDPRVARVSAALAASEGAPRSAETLARIAGLSASRLQHLFAAEIGVPIRRYRSWIRMRRAIEEIVAGANFTAAAHAAGFADQAHFAHDFRRTFGAPASRSLSGVRR